MCGNIYLRVELPTETTGTNAYVTMALGVSLPCVLALALSVFTVVGFNVDTRLPTVRTGPEDSMFGFDVSLHIDRDRYW